MLRSYTFYRIFQSILKYVLLQIIFVLGISTLGHAQTTYRISGSLIDKESGKPISGAQIWIYGTRFGDITDNDGNFSLQLTSERVGRTSLYAYVCGNSLGNKKWLDFQTDAETVDLFYKYQISIPENCPDLEKPPWSIGLKDTTKYKGHIYFSWEGGTYLETCDGQIYVPTWPENTKLWEKSPEEGERKFILFTGRSLKEAKGFTSTPVPIFHVKEILKLEFSNSPNCK